MRMVTNKSSASLPLIAIISGGITNRSFPFTVTSVIPCDKPVALQWNDSFSNLTQNQWVAFEVDFKDLNICNCDWQSAGRWVRDYDRVWISSYQRTKFFWLVSWQVCWWYNQSTLSDWSRRSVVLIIFHWRDSRMFQAVSQWAILALLSSQVPINVKHYLLLTRWSVNDALIRQSHSSHFLISSKSVHPIRVACIREIKRGPTQRIGCLDYRLHCSPKDSNMPEHSSNYCVSLRHSFGHWLRDRSIYARDCCYLHPSPRWCPLVRVVRSEFLTQHSHQRRSCKWRCCCSWSSIWRVRESRSSNGCLHQR